jgi:uncharacterized Zn-binding protein involved in type VI secretion
MPGIARDAGTDVAGGAIVQGSGNVFVNGQPVSRIGDSVAGHGRGAHRSPVMVGGSGNVFANGISVCRAGDPASCGHPASGSGNVFAN